MAKARGLLPSRVGFPASLEVALTRRPLSWSYTASTGISLSASPAVGSQSWSHQEHGSRSWQEKERCRLKVVTLMLLPKGAFYFGTHKHDSVFNVLEQLSHSCQDFH